MYELKFITKYLKTNYNPNY